MIDFSIMDTAVDKLCESMKNTPEDWTIETFYVYHKVSDIKYWIGLTETITEVWNGSSREEVFNKEQGDKLYSAMIAMKERNGSETQKKIISFIPVKDIVQEEGGTKDSWWKRLFS